MSTKINNMSIAYEITKVFVNEHIKESLRNDPLIFTKYFKREINRLNGVETSEHKEVEAVESEKYKNKKFYITQRMSYAHTESDNALAFLDEELYINGIYNSKNSIEAVNMSIAKLLSEKYSHNKYSYAEYFYNKLIDSANKYNSRKFRQSVPYTEFSIQTVDYDTAQLLNKKVDEYNKLHEKMHTKKVKFETLKHKLNMLSSVQNFKKFKNLIAEYQKCISDLTFKLATYENVDSKYNSALILSYRCLIIQAQKNLELAEIKMLQDKKFIVMRDKVETLKSTYKKSLKEVINYRRNFAEFLIYKKVAAYIYINPINNKKIINGIKWNLKTPSGKLHSKTTLSSLQKSYNVVKFDKVQKKLIINEGL